MAHLSIEVLSLLADEMLEQKKAEECHRHIASCPVCEQIYDDMVAMSFAMAKLETVSPPGGYEAFAQGILENLPPQDEVSGEKTVEIKEHRVKQDFIASINWQQILGYGAMVAILATMFMPQEGQVELASPSSLTEGSFSDSVSEDSGVATMGGDMMLREMEEPMDVETEAISMATPSASVVEDYSPDDLATAWEAMVYYGENGMELTEEEGMDVVRLLLDLRQVSGENFWPVVLHFQEEIPELSGSWAVWGELRFTTRSYGEVAPYLQGFEEVEPSKQDEYLLVVVGG